MLTAKDGEYDQTDAFDLGADDYLTKPFSFTRAGGAATGAGARTRRAPRGPDGRIAVDGPLRRVVRRNGTPISLTPREYGLLEYLMRNKDTVVTKTEIFLRTLLGRTLRGRRQRGRGVRGLRASQDVDIPFGTNTIQTVRGVGYRLESGSYAIGN